ncbi:MAG TPA: hypothetical protein VEF04_23475 [Blastocatellia bacterium]|nr:hypothetical protein [Blastocatellia bacterium]
MNFLVILALLPLLGCKKNLDIQLSTVKPGQSLSPSQTIPTNTQSTETTKYPELKLFDEWADDKNIEPIAYNGFEVVRKTKKIKVPESSNLAELSYAQILRNGKAVMTIDGGADRDGNETLFGLFPFLSPNSKQLFVQQNIYRGKHQWIVSLDSQQPRVLMDLSSYNLDSFGAIDIDRNGQYELVGYQKYWYFQYLKEYSFSSADSPVIPIVFAYNPKAQKYEPANLRFRPYLLEQVEEMRSRAERTDSLMSRMSAVMEGTMTLALIGEEKAAWEFFDQYCRVEKDGEKEDAQRRIEAAIQKHPLYRAIKQSSDR